MHTETKDFTIKKIYLNHGADIFKYLFQYDLLYWQLPIYLVDEDEHLPCEVSSFLSHSSGWT